MNDSSFEDIETSYTKELEQRKPHQEKLPTPSTATSSVGTIFSNGTKHNKWFNEVENDEDLNNITIDDNKGYVQPFYNEFQDFANKKDDFDEAIKTHVRAKNRSPTRRTQEFVNYFQQEMNNNMDGRKMKSSFSSLRHPKSMSELKSKQRFYSNDNHTDDYYHNNNNNQISTNYHSLKSSLSHGNLRNPERKNSVRFKNSVNNFNTNDMEFSIREESEDEEEDEEEDVDSLASEENHDQNNDTVVIGTMRNENALHKYSEEQSSDYNFADDDDFIFGNDAIQPQFLVNPARWEAESLISNNFHDDTDVEFPPQLSNRARKEFRSNSSPTSKLRTIKQTIDINTPVKNENMYYHGNNSQWRKASYRDKVGSNTKNSYNSNKPYLIPNNQEFPSLQDDIQDNLKNMKIRAHSDNPRVVGSMVLDEKNQRWVSVNGDEYDPFVNIKSVPLPMRKKNSSPFLRTRSSRATLMSFKNARRYQSSSERNNATDPIDPQMEMNINYVINSRTLEKFYHEENRWQRKVGAWFTPGRNDSPMVTENNRSDDQALTKHMGDMSLTGKNNSEYMYEIRKMVLNSARN